MPLEIELDALGARILGVLIEKELTTPDQYPLSMNALVAGCNQKNNRDPVLDLLESDVAAGVQKLIHRFAVGSVHPAGSRVERFRHNAREVLKVDGPQLAILCELLLRGAQQPGELRARVARMHSIDTLEQLYESLKPMIEGGLVRRLDPLPGSRAERFVQLLTPLSSAPAPSVSATITVAACAPMAAATTAPAGTPPISRAEFEELQLKVLELEEKEARLRRQLDHLAWSLGKKLEG
jgi:uncharacterized protein YceH (UPF0502 family)